MTGPTHEDPLFLLAFDHRDSFAKLYGDEIHPTGAELSHLEGVKEVIFDGLVRARGSVAVGRVGALADEEFGSPVIARARAEGIELAVPIEASGREWFQPLWGDAWLEHIERIRPDYGKVLVRDNPDFDPDERAGQLDRLRGVSEGLAGIGVPLIYELLVPASPQQLAAAEDDPDLYDTDVRAGLTAQLIAENYAHGIRPALWKIEGLESVDDAREVAAAVIAGDPDARLIVLGRDASRERVDHWLAVAAAVPEFVGFAIGRTIWQDVVRPLGPDADAHALERAAAEIADRYLGFVAAWQAALPADVGGPR